jgi:hypothetical protein
MADKQYGPIDERELAVRVVERNLLFRPIPGTRGNLQRLTSRELEYLRWLGEKVIGERGLPG